MGKDGDDEHDDDDVDDDDDDDDVTSYTIKCTVWMQQIIEAAKHGFPLNP